METAVQGIYQQIISIFHPSQTVSSITPQSSRITKHEPQASDLVDSNGEKIEMETLHGEAGEELNHSVKITNSTANISRQINISKVNAVNAGIGVQEVTEELIFESIENASGNGSDYGSCEEKDPVYEEVETEEEIYADCSIKNHPLEQPLREVLDTSGGLTPQTRSPVDCSITSDLSRDMLTSPNSSQHSNYAHSNSALSDPECDSDLLLKCSSPEEEDDLLCEMQSKQDIQDINEINEAARDNALISIETPKVDHKKLMPQALKPVPVEETIIAREIRLQREREDEIQKEREEARRRAAEKMGSLSGSTGSLLDERPASKSTPFTRPLATSTPKGARDVGALKIEDEIRQLKEREDELRRVRESLQQKVQQQEILDFKIEPQQSDPKQDTKTDTVVRPSPISSASPIPKQTTRRAVKVRPLDDGDEIPETTVYQHETPIEREIRLARERDEALRREKGLLTGRRDSVDSSSILSERSTTSSTSSSCTDLRSPRTPVHNMVTSKIQKEIEEQNRKELELKKEGVIRTISVERSDSKVAKIGAEVEAPRPRTFSSSSSGSCSTQTAAAPFRRPAFGTVARGISMQKFIASQGKKIVPTRPIEPRWVEAPSSRQPRFELGTVNLENKCDAKPRRHLVTAQSKIQQELKLFKERETELRRMRKLGGSHPNLSTLVVATDIPVSDEDDDDDFVKDDTSPKGLYPSLRQRVLSNPNLLDCDEPAKVPEPLAPIVRKKSAMVAEWENRIRQIQESK
ncbi:uncharacterized protein LOC100909032 [Galendromus occidentalis]|uniref:Uncharacterized protein LOC100909032 n=1 Tax=Galendromus occidentalis TaxID=34638 RepID=A0AAJ7L7P2_9ACAR|nr:uncharacterized protein LOC100909032 [Galendromus occidentalis]